MIGEPGKKGSLLAGAIRSTTVEATTYEGGRLGAVLVPGDVVAIYGGLGAGKTIFVGGVCAALGVTQQVSSPTFTLVHEYPARACTVYHFDFYRIEHIDELSEIGFGDYLADPLGICLIEWADRVEDVLPAGRYDVMMSGDDDPRLRLIEIVRHADNAGGGR